MRARALPVSPNYSLSATFGDPLRIRDWQLAGLPADQCATHASYLITCSALLQLCSLIFTITIRIGIQTRESVVSQVLD